MGRIKPKIPACNFWLRPSTNQRGETPIYVRYYVQGRYIKKTTNVFINPADWDSKMQVVKSKNRQSAVLNGKLMTFKQKIHEQLLSYNGNITYKVVDTILNGSEKQDDKSSCVILFKQYADKLNELMFSRNTYGYSVYYNNSCYINQFDKFVTNELNQPNLNVADINLDLINKFVEYKRNRRGNTSIEGINHCLTPIIRTVKYARDNGLIDSVTANPIINDGYMSIKDRSYNPDMTDAKKIHYLTQEQIQKFKEYKPISNSKNRTLEIMDIFLFAYYACGLRISDIVTLEWSNIDFKNKKINKVQVKTKTKGKVPPTLPQQAIDILKKWKGKGRNTRFVFDLLPENWTFGDDKISGRKLKMRINSVDKTLNTSLNEIGKKLGFKFPLTMHVARHTFCVTALNNGVSLHVVSQLMGHASILATEKTYAEFLDETVTNEMCKLDVCFN